MPYHWGGGGGSYITRSNRSQATNLFPTFANLSTQCLRDEKGGASYIDKGSHNLRLEGFSGQSSCWLSRTLEDPENQDFWDSEPYFPPRSSQKFYFKKQPYRAITIWYLMVQGATSKCPKGGLSYQKLHFSYLWWLGVQGIGVPRVGFSLACHHFPLMDPQDNPSVCPNWLLWITGWAGGVAQLAEGLSGIREALCWVLSIKWSIYHATHL